MFNVEIDWHEVTWKSRDIDKHVVTHNITDSNQNIARSLGTNSRKLGHPYMLKVCKEVQNLCTVVV